MRRRLYPFYLFGRFFWLPPVPPTLIVWADSGT